MKPNVLFSRCWERGWRWKLQSQGSSAVLHRDIRGVQRGGLREVIMGNEDPVKGRWMDWHGSGWSQVELSLLIASKPVQIWQCFIFSTVVLASWGQYLRVHGFSKNRG